MSKYILAVLLLLSPMRNLLAQDPNDPSSRAWQVLAANQNTVLPEVDRAYIDLVGTPFLLDEWTEGALKMKNGLEFEGLELKYDVFQDGLWYKDAKTKNVLVVDPTVVQLFSVQDSLMNLRQFRYLEEKDVEIGKDEFNAGYYEVLLDKGSKIYCKWTKDFIEADYKGAYSAGTRYDEFRNNNPRYYLMKADKTWFKLNKSKSSILNALSDKEEAVQTYIKTNKIKFRSVEDLVNVVKYYDTLQ